MELLQDYVVTTISVATFGVLFMCKPLFTIKGKDFTKWIPLVAGVIGIGLCAWINLTFNFNVLLEGMASGLSATGLDQLIKQTTNYYNKEGE